MMTGERTEYPRNFIKLAIPNWQTAELSNYQTIKLSEKSPHRAAIYRLESPHAYPDFRY